MCNSQRKLWFVQQRDFWADPRDLRLSDRDSDREARFRPGKVLSRFGQRDQAKLAVQNPSTLVCGAAFPIIRVHPTTSLLSEIRAKVYNRSIQIGNAAQEQGKEGKEAGRR